MLRVSGGSTVAHMWRRRLAAALAATFFVAGSAESLALHRCPHHHAAPAPTDGMAHAMDAEHAAPGHDDAACQCIGDCHGGASVPSSAAPASGNLLGIGARPTGDDPPSEHVPIPVSHFLPFANAPPLIR